MERGGDRPASGLAAGAVALAVAVLIATVAVLIFATPGDAVPQLGSTAASCEVSEAASAPTDSVTAAPPSSWPATLVQRGVDPQAIDVATRSLYELDVTYRDNGYGRVQRVDWRTHATTSGAVFRVSSVALAAGALWVYGDQTFNGVATGPVLCQLNPRTLKLVRQVMLPPLIGTPGGMTLAPGSGHTVWLGYGRTIAQVNAITGTTQMRFTVPSGSIADLSTSPDRHLLYVSLSYPVVDGATLDAQVLQMAPNGTVIAATAGGPSSGVSWSVAGGQVIGLADGAAYSARTGMDGQTIILTGGTLATITAPGERTTQQSLFVAPDDVFAWPMDATMLYSAGSLWVANGYDVLACVDPTTSAVRASEGGPHDHGSQLEIEGEALTLLGTDRSQHTLFAVAGDDLYAITAPASCWK